MCSLTSASYVSESLAKPNVLPCSVVFLSIYLFVLFLRSLFLTLVLALFIYLPHTKKSVGHVYQSFFFITKLNWKKAMNFFSLLFLILLNVFEKSRGKILVDQIQTDVVSTTPREFQSNASLFSIGFI